MKFLLDVNVLIAANVATHDDHGKTMRWLAGRPVVLCPLCELGFLRISTNDRILGFSMADARRLLEAFAARTGAERISDDLPALESHPSASGQVTDYYLADLAIKHGLRLATLDARLHRHRAVELIA